MDTIIRRKAQLSVAAVAALAIFAVAAVMLLASGFNTSPAQAQGGSTDGSTGSNTSPWPDPQPCGPGASKAEQPEPHEVTKGHFALFDSYEYIEGDLGDDADEAPSPNVLRANTCPPKVTITKTDDGRGNVTVTTTRKESNIDIDEAIFHVLHKHQATVVDSRLPGHDPNAVTGPTIDLKEYPQIEDHTSVGKKVWWLRLDDPDTTDVDEKSGLSLGFSTGLLDRQYWLTSEDGDDEALRYMFEVERFPGSTPNAPPHFFVYNAPNAGNAPQSKEVWNSTRVHFPTEVVQMDPGENREVQWIFTKEGTYLISVHIRGYVRQENPYKTVDPKHAEWKAISDNVTETSEVKQYTIQVGDPLVEMEPPTFGVNLSVPENSPPGTKVGGPIQVYNSEAKTLEYKLDGEGSEHFGTVASTDPHSVQVVVAEGASLDYETQASYDLALSVTDNVDHENNRNTETDDILVVRIDLDDDGPWLKLEADRSTQKVDQTVNLVATFETTPEWNDETPNYQWAEKAGTPDHTVWHVISTAPNAPTWSVSQSSPVTKTYRVAIVHGEDFQTTFVSSNQVTVTWEN